jgi:hypothetical protein
MQAPSSVFAVLNLRLEEKLVFSFFVCKVLTEDAGVVDLGCSPVVFGVHPALQTGKLSSSFSELPAPGTFRSKSSSLVDRMQREEGEGRAFQAFECGAMKNW